MMAFYFFFNNLLNSSLSRNTPQKFDFSRARARFLRIIFSRICFFFFFFFFFKTSPDQLKVE
jgi:hypothetical protein